MNRPVCSTCGKELVNIEYGSSNYETFICIQPGCSNKKVQIHRLKDGVS